MKLGGSLVVFLGVVGISNAQPVELTNTDTVRFWWGAVENAVAYETKLAYLDGTESIPRISGAPPRQFTPRKGIVFKLAVRACTVEPDTGLVVCEGEWSEPSVDVRLCPIAADVDCNLAVGMSDFGLVMRDWGMRDE